MTIADDSAKLLAYMDNHGLNGSNQVTRGWDHIGAIVVDSVLQRRQQYAATVQPRVLRLIKTWPDADTVSGFRTRIESGTLATVIQWKSAARLTQIAELTSVLEDQKIETVDDLRDKLIDPVQRPTLRTALRSVRNVGPKTLDYFDILTGIPSGVAIDVRIRTVTSATGIKDMSYAHLAAVIRDAATSRGWRAGDLDAALWKS